MKKSNRLYEDAANSYYFYTMDQYRLWRECFERYVQYYVKYVITTENPFSLYDIHYNHLCKNLSNTY